MTDPSESADSKPLTIRLDQFLQLAQIAGTGGQAKQLIQQGNVSVNGEIETRRRRQLHVGGDTVFTAPTE